MSSLISDFGVVSSGGDYTHDFEKMDVVVDENLRCASAVANPDACFCNLEDVRPSIVYTRPTMVLDLDETIVHSIYTRDPLLISDLINRPNMLVTFKDIGGETLIVFYRPYVVEFLTILSYYYDIIIYTNASPPYCDIVTMHLTQLCGRSVFKQCFSRMDQFAPLDKKLEFINVSHEVAVILDDRVDVWVSNLENLVVATKFLGPLDTDYMCDTMLLDTQEQFVSLYYQYISNDVKDMKKYIPKYFNRS